MIIRYTDVHKVLLVLILIGFYLDWIVNVIIRYKDCYKVLLVSFLQIRIMVSFWLGCVSVTRQKEHMDAKISVIIFTGLLYYYCILEYCLWRYMELVFKRIVAFGLIISLYSRISEFDLCSHWFLFVTRTLVDWLGVFPDQVYVGDSLIWRFYTSRLILVFVVYTVLAVFMLSVVIELILRFSTITCVKKSSFPKSISVEL